VGPGLRRGERNLGGDKMNLDTLVKLSQIATPFVLLGLGFFVSISVNKYIQNQKITSDFNTRWSDRFIEKCVSYSEVVTQVTQAFYRTTDGKQHEEEALGKLEDLVHQVRNAEHEVRIHSQLVDNGDNVINVVSEIHGKVTLLYKNKGGNIDEITQLQVRLHKRLRKLQKSILNLK